MPAIECLSYENNWHKVVNSLVDDLEQRIKLYDNSLLVDVNDEIAIFCKNKLDENKIIIIEDINNITLDNIKLYDESNDFISDYKNSCLRALARTFKNRIDIDVIFSSLKFALGFSYLASKGYYITQENREEMYMNIIATNDPELFMVLEDYVDSLTNLEKSLIDYKKFATATHNIISTHDVDLISNYFSEYINYPNVSTQG